MQPKYKRVLLKLSGEALAGEKDKGILDDAFLDRVAAVVARCVAGGVEVAVIVGAGNIWRGRQGAGMDRTRGDTMGMLATTINALALQDAFLRAGVDTRVMSALSMPAVAEFFTRDAALAHLKAGRAVVFAGGTGHPYFSTDTAAALRAIEIEADVILMAKNIDGIYTADPRLDTTAVRLDSLRYADILEKNLRAVDLTSAALCMENGLPTLVFGLHNPENIWHAVCGEAVGTLITA